MRLFGLFTLLIRPAVWLLLGAAFVAGMFYEKTHQRDLCDRSGGTWMRGGFCQGAAP